jgi:hypothetical protein
MITKVSNGRGKIRVTFAMPAAIWADTIHLVGDFNKWNSNATPLTLDDDNWSITLELEPGQEYQYRYLVNGVDWYNDWQADRYEPNEHGGDNSVVVTTVGGAFPDVLEPCDEMDEHRSFEIVMPLEEYVYELNDYIGDELAEIALPLHGPFVVGIGSLTDY